MATGRHRLALVLLVVVVALAHGLLADRIAQGLPDLQGPPIERLQAAFVRELQPAEPLAPAPPTPPSAARRPAAAPTASAPEPPASTPEPAAPVAVASPEPPVTAAVSDSPVPESAPEPPPEVVAAASAPVPELAVQAASAPTTGTGTVPFEWPLSTRLSYTLTGNVRGEVSGHAQVEWLREDERYQVRVEVILGPAFAPLMQRRMTSDGRITAQGLAPRRYDEETQVAFAAPRRAGVVFDTEGGVTLANGQRLEALPGLQDTASQFVQLTWLFATGAEALRAGGEVVVPLVLPRRLDRWVYDVVGEELLDTPFGALPTWHLKPRREGTLSVLSIETWFAPRLQYLPVRIVIRQGPDSFIEMMIERLPQQAAAPMPAPGSP